MRDQCQSLLSLLMKVLEMKRPMSNSFHTIYVHRSKIGAATDTDLLIYADTDLLIYTDTDCS